MKKEAKLRTFSWGIKCTSVVFGLLFYWLLSFVLEDLHFVSEPSYKTITAEFVDKQLKEKRKRLNESISQVNRNIRGMEEKQKCPPTSRPLLTRPAPGARAVAAVTEC